ncbi:MAG: 50S ribosomal protein L10 [Planctomycetes bacterium]|nr:50S ribosomal protein L10 [Planctomycetota bacterium]
MSKTIKAMVTDDLRVRYREVRSACVVDLTGLNVQEQQGLRATLRTRSGRLEVMRNSLARRAFQDGPLEPLSSTLVGPCALVTGSESVIELAKALVEAAQEFTQLKLKHAIMEGVPDLLTVEILAKMKSHRELIAEVAQLIGSPARALAGCLASPQSRIAGCLKALIEKAA